MNNYKKDWSAYWKTGFSGSCVANNSDEFPAAVKSFWKGFCLSTFKNNMQILDLCSGGGVLPHLFVKVSDDDLHLTINSSDYSEVEHDTFNLGHKKINFMANCNCENLPFNTNSYDILTSSYGIEYSHIEKTIAETKRVMKSGGYFALVMHTDDSEIVKNAQLQRQQGQFILEKSGFFNSFKKYYQAKRIGKAFQNSAEKKLQQALNAIKKQMLAYQNAGVFNSVLEAASDTFHFGQSHSPSATIKHIQQMERALKQNFNRMKNLQEIVHQEKTIIKCIESTGFTITFNKKIKQGNKIFGRGLICQKIS